MKLFRSFYSLFFIIIFAAQIATAQTEITRAKIDDRTTAITLTLPLQQGEYVYKEYIDISTDNPNIELSEWKSSADAVVQYDETFKENKKILKDTVTITFNATKKNGWAETDNAQLHFSYYLNSRKAMTEEIIPITPQQPVAELAYAVQAEEVMVQTQLATPAPAPTCPAPSRSFSDCISQLAQNTQSLWLRLLLVFLLGMLLSLTPCIYPMIPITVGILQSRGSKSLLANFVISLTYVAGVATTFALLGLMAAFTGQMVGSMMSNPIVILAIVALLIYTALSMFGFYEMYVPKSFQSNGSSLKSGSLISTFFFGALSGSVASPCLSPGLVLLLSIVSTLGSKLLGFALLFTFGLGLGLPLLIIGTFSSSISMLPRAGMWMVEIKKLSGLLLLGMCFYFLKAILPLFILLVLLALFMLGSGIWLFYDATKTSSPAWVLFKNILGGIMVAGAVVTAMQAYKALYTSSASLQESIWQMDFDKAVSKAKVENKLLFIDIGAPFCSICTAIDNTVLKNQRVLEALCLCVPVKIDGSDATSFAVKHLQQHYTIVGFPTFLLIDPTNNALIKRWGSELYDMPPESFAQELADYAKWQA